MTISKPAEEALMLVVERGDRKVILEAGPIEQQLRMGGLIERIFGTHNATPAGRVVAGYVRRQRMVEQSAAEFTALLDEQSRIDADPTLVRCLRDGKEVVARMRLTSAGIEFEHLSGYSNFWVKLPVPINSWSFAGFVVPESQRSKVRAFVAAGPPAEGGSDDDGRADVVPVGTQSRDERDDAVGVPVTPLPAVPSAGRAHLHGLPSVPRPRVQWTDDNGVGWHMSELDTDECVGTDGVPREMAPNEVRDADGKPYVMTVERRDDGSPIRLVFGSWGWTPGDAHASRAGNPELVPGQVERMQAFWDANQAPPIPAPSAELAEDEFQNGQGRRFRMRFIGDKLELRDEVSVLACSPAEVKTHASDRWFKTNPLGWPRALEFLERKLKEMKDGRQTNETDQRVAPAPGAVQSTDEVRSSGLHGQHLAQPDAASSNVSALPKVGREEVAVSAAVEGEAESADQTLVRDYSAAVWTMSSNAPMPADGPAKVFPDVRFFGPLDMDAASSAHLLIVGPKSTDAKVLLTSHLKALLKVAPAEVVVGAMSETVKMEITRLVWPNTIGSQEVRLKEVIDQRDLLETQLMVGRKNASNAAKDLDEALSREQEALARADGWKHKADGLEKALEQRHADYVAQMRRAEKAEKEELRQRDEHAERERGDAVRELERLKVAAVAAIREVVAGPEDS